MVNSGKRNLTPFFPETIVNEVNNPIHAFLEKVKTVAIPVEIKKLKEDKIQSLQNQMRQTAKQNEVKTNTLNDKIHCLQIQLQTSKKIT